jgi:hypothetical protein
MPLCRPALATLLPHLDIQQLLLSDYLDGDRKQASDYFSIDQPAGTVHLQPEHDRRGRGEGGDPDTSTKG